MPVRDYLNHFRQCLSRGCNSRRPETLPKRLKLDRLEDRLVPSTATLSGTTPTFFLQHPVPFVLQAQ
jgi:hypothetical protein